MTRFHDPAEHRASQTAVSDARGMCFATEANVIEARIGRLAGVDSVSANATGESATVAFDPGQTTVAIEPVGTGRPRSS